MSHLRIFRLKGKRDKVRFTVNQFLVMFGRIPVFMGSTDAEEMMKCPAQGHSTVSPVSLELAILRSQVYRGYLLF